MRVALKCFLLLSSLKSNLQLQNLQKCQRQWGILAVVLGQRIETLQFVVELCHNNLISDAYDRSPRNQRKYSQYCWRFFTKNWPIINATVIWFFVLILLPIFTPSMSDIYTGDLEAITHFWRLVEPVLPPVNISILILTNIF